MSIPTLWEWWLMLTANQEFVPFCLKKGSVANAMLGNMRTMGFSSWCFVQIIKNCSDECSEVSSKFILSLLRYRSIAMVFNSETLSMPSMQCCGRYLCLLFMWLCNERRWCFWFNWNQIFVIRQSRHRDSSNDTSRALFPWAIVKWTRFSQWYFSNVELVRNALIAKTCGIVSYSWIYVEHNIACISLLHRWKELLQRSLPAFYSGTWYLWRKRFSFYSTGVACCWKSTRQWPKQWG